MRMKSHVLPTERIALPRRLVPRRPLDFTKDPRFAYLQWLQMEARLLQIELGLGDEHNFCPSGTASHSFHFPSGQSWRDQPQPSTRAETVLRTVGVKVPTGVLVPEDVA